MVKSRFPIKQQNIFFYSHSGTFRETVKRIYLLRLDWKVVFENLHKWRNAYSKCEDIGWNVDKLKKLVKKNSWRMEAENIAQWVGFPTVFGLKRLVKLALSRHFIG